MTTDFPNYFAVITRIRQEVHAIGPEGGMVSSTVVPQVQAIFPEGALTKKIKVGLQVRFKKQSAFSRLRAAFSRKSQPQIVDCSVEGRLGQAAGSAAVDEVVEPAIVLAIAEGQSEGTKKDNQLIGNGSIANGGQLIAKQGNGEVSEVAQMNGLPIANGGKVRAVANGGQKFMGNKMPLNGSAGNEGRRGGMKARLFPNLDLFARMV